MEEKNNRIEDLRGHLFDTIQKLKDGTIDIDKAKAIRDLGQVIVNTAKVEVMAMKEIKGFQGTGFIPIHESQKNKALKSKWGDKYEVTGSKELTIAEQREIVAKEDTLYHGLISDVPGWLRKELKGKLLTIAERFKYCTIYKN